MVRGSLWSGGIAVTLTRGGRNKTKKTKKTNTPPPQKKCCATLRYAFSNCCSTAITAAVRIMNAAARFNESSKNRCYHRKEEWYRGGFLRCTDSLRLMVHREQRPEHASPASEHIDAQPASILWSSLSRKQFGGFCWVMLCCWYSWRHIFGAHPHLSPPFFPLLLSPSPISSQPTAFLSDLFVLRTSFAPKPPDFIKHPVHSYSPTSQSTPDTQGWIMKWTPGWTQITPVGFWSQVGQHRYKTDWDGERSDCTGG